MLSPDDGCRHCGTIDSTHDVNCPSQRRKLPGAQNKIHTPEFKGLRIGDDCEICEGPCKYGNCGECRGHSEHNYGCSRI